MKPIFCGNFEYDARQSDLERLFGKYGKVDRVDMKSGFAFIYMEDERDAEDAIQGLDRREFGRKGRRLRVEWTKHERAGGSRRPSGGSGSRRPSANGRPSKTLFVINFDPYHTRTRDLERHFDSYGKITSVRIRRNFAFVQYESQDDATRALESTNMSKLMDRVISVEYAVRDDDEKRNGLSPDRSRDRSPDRRRRSPSPYRRERDSPDYGRGPSPYRRERASPDYGRRRSTSPYRRDKASPDYGRGTSRSPLRSEKPRADRGRVSSQSPPRREKGNAARDYDTRRSPYGRHNQSPANGKGTSTSDGSPYEKEERASSENGRRQSSHSPYEHERVNSKNGHGSTPNSVPENRDSPYGGPESPMQERYSSRSPVADD